MSRRSFLRAFRRATGSTPAAWVRSRRLDEARRLLDLGVPGGRTETLVEALLRGASQREVLRLSGGDVPLDALLDLADAARASYVTSVRLALLGAAVVVLLTAGLTARWLQPGVDQLDDA